MRCHCALCGPGSLHAGEPRIVESHECAAQQRGFFEEDVDVYVYCEACDSYLSLDCLDKYALEAADDTPPSRRHDLHDPYDLWAVLACGAHRGRAPARCFDNFIAASDGACARADSNNHPLTARRVAR